MSVYPPSRAYNRSMSRGDVTAAQAITAAELSAERPPCTLGALARILQLETLDVGAVPSSACVFALNSRRSRRKGAAATHNTG